VSVRDTMRTWPPVLLFLALLCVGFLQTKHAGASVPAEEEECNAVEGGADERARELAQESDAADAVGEEWDSHDDSDDDDDDDNYEEQIQEGEPPLGDDVTDQVRRECYKAAVRRAGRGKVSGEDFGDWMAECECKAAKHPPSYCYDILSKLEQSYGDDDSEDGAST
jgi:hypothetical protein